VRYISYVTRDDTAISWAEPAAVTAIKTIANKSTAPVSPKIVEAAVGATSPLLISAGVNGTSNAMADNPRVVAMVKESSHGRLRPCRDCPLPIRLVDKDCTKIAHYVNDSED
jgi:hypothetical protein